MFDLDEFFQKESCRNFIMFPHRIANIIYNRPIAFVSKAYDLKDMDYHVERANSSDGIQFHAERENRNKFSKQIDSSMCIYRILTK